MLRRKNLKEAIKLRATEFHIMGESERYREWYTTGEVAKILGVSFRTVKRWIYSGKIEATKTAGGHYRISREVLERLRSEVGERSAEDIIKFIDEREIVYLREVQLNFEDKYPHYETSNKLNLLITQKRVNAIFEYGRRWFFPLNSNWDSLKDRAKAKLDLVKVYETYEREFEKDGVKYQDYSEYIVEQAMIRAGYTVVAKDSYYFNGKACVLQSSRGRPPDLDFIAELPDGGYAGVQVKNRVEYPKPDVVEIFIRLCQGLQLRPLLVVRQAHPMTFDVVRKQNGRVVVFKQIFLKPGFPRETLDALRQMGIPVAVYRWPPDYLVRALKDAAVAVSKL